MSAEFGERDTPPFVLLVVYSHEVSRYICCFDTLGIIIDVRGPFILMHLRIINREKENI